MFSRYLLIYNTIPYLKCIERNSLEEVYIKQNMIGWDLSDREATETKIRFSNYQSPTSLRFLVRDKLYTQNKFRTELPVRLDLPVLYLFVSIILDTKINSIKKKKTSAGYKHFKFTSQSKF